MKKETFVSLMKAIEKHMRVAEQFGKDISNAYIKAGAERDFAFSASYEPPYGKFVDSIIDAIGTELSNDIYKAEWVTDFLNWWIYETGFGKEKVYNFADGNVISKPSAEVTLSNGNTYLITTPGKLYDVILKDQKIKLNEHISTNA
jgi:hypothetical protein